MMGPEEANNCVLLDTKKLSNGQHSIKVATVDINGLITMSEAFTVDTNNELYYVTKSLYFEPNDGYPVYAMSDTNSNFRVRLARWDGNTIWTSEASSGGLNVTVPSSVLTGQIYNVVLEIDTNEPPTWRILCEEPSKSRRRRPGPYIVAIFLPNGSFPNGEITSDCRWQAVDELIRYCEERHFNYIILYREECTWEGFKAVLSQPTIRYVYMVGHGGNRVPTDPNYPNPVHRLWFVVSGTGDKGINDTEPVFSSRGGLPLGWDVNPRGHSMEELGLYDSDYIRLVYMTVCNQGESHEMSRKWIHYLGDVAPIGQLFCGWDGIPQGYDRDWQQWDYDFWHVFGQGNPKTALDAYNHAYRENPWGWWLSPQFSMLGYKQVTFDHDPY
jgi:hypothetical protein